MIKKILVLIKRFIVAVLLLYAYNKMAFPLNLFIPMNVFTIGMVTFFGIPSIIMLVFFSVICI